MQRVVHGVGLRPPGRLISSVVVFTALLLVAFNHASYGGGRIRPPSRLQRVGAPPVPSTLEPLEPPEGIDLLRATREILASSSCGKTATAQGVGCGASSAAAVSEILAADRWDDALHNPCLPGTDGPCVPYFYVLGAFHSGARDLFDRLKGHEDIFIPAARGTCVPGKRCTGDAEAYPYYFTETHPWDRMLWRGCDYGRCPRRRGVGAEPLRRSELPELDGQVGKRRVFGEASGGMLTFTWSLTHSLLHLAWDKNLSSCRLPKAACFGPAVEAQRAWEASIGGGTHRRFGVPWLMRGLHGTDKVRLLAILREPAARMHSAYWFWPQYRRRYGHDARGFVKYVDDVVPAFKACLAAQQQQQQQQQQRRRRRRQRQRQQCDARCRRFALEECAFNFESLNFENEGVYYHADQLLKSLYAAYVPTWLRAFGSRRLLVLRAEDYWRDPAAGLARAWRFLGLSQPPPAEAARLAAAPRQLIHGSDATFWGDKAVTNSLVAADVARAAGRGPNATTRQRYPMHPEAWRTLRGFFAEHNADLARQLGDERFRWDDIEPPAR